MHDVGLSIESAVREADAMAGNRRSRKVWIAYPGDGLRYTIMRSAVKVGAQQRVTRVDLERLAASSSPSPGHCILHRLLVSATLDGVETLEDPTGMTACRLEANLLAIEAMTQQCEGLARAVSSAHLECQGFIPGSLALEAVLTPAEKEIGTAVLDLGAHHTTAAIFARSAPRHIAVVGIGGLHVTRDLAVALGLPLGKAEQEKIILCFRHFVRWAIVPPGHGCSYRRDPGTGSHGTGSGRLVGPGFKVASF